MSQEASDFHARKEEKHGSRAHAKGSDVMVITEVTIRPVCCHMSPTSGVVTAAVFIPPPPKSPPEGEGVRSISRVNTKSRECRV